MVHWLAAFLSYPSFDCLGSWAWMVFRCCIRLVRRCNLATIYCTCCLCWWWVLHAHSAWLVPLVSLFPIEYFLAYHLGQLWLLVAAPGRDALQYPCGYLGMQKTIEALQQRIWWPGMAQDVRHFIAGCLPYLWLKDWTSLPPGSLAPILLPLDHFSFWTTDFITSLPKDQNCNAIFTCIDKLTKLVRLTPYHMGEGLLSTE